MSYSLWHLYLLNIFLVSISLASFANPDTPSTSVAVDLLGNAKIGGRNHSLFVREAEYSITAPVDHLFDEAVLSLAAHRHHGVANFEIHEAFVSSSKLIGDTRFTLGQYFLGVGRLNRFHRHDWPFISSPKFFRTFFDSEGLLDSGFELSYLLPSKFYLNLTAGVTSGWTFGHSHSEGSTPIVPTHYARLSSYQDITDDIGTDFGLNYIGRVSSENKKMYFGGFDFVLKNRPQSYDKWLTQAEIWHKWEKQDSQASYQRKIGFYLYNQYGFSKELFAGLRLDYYSDLTKETEELGERLSNADYAIIPNLTYKNSEFLTFRLAYNYALKTQANAADATSQNIQFQCTYILGAHPAHDF